MIRQVTFSPPNESPAIYWMAGHVSATRFVRMYDITGNTPIADKIVQGWGMCKPSDNSMYLSDEPLPDFEPITYWIPRERIFA